MPPRRRLPPPHAMAGFTVAMLVAAAACGGNQHRPAAGADVAVGLAASPRGTPTSTVTFTVTVTNRGPQQADQVLLRAQVPAAGLGPPTSSDCRIADRTVTCSFIALPAGQAAQITFQAAATGTAGRSVAVTVARVASRPVDPVSGNDTATARCRPASPTTLRC